MTSGSSSLCERKRLSKLTSQVSAEETATVLTSSNSKANRVKIVPMPPIISISNLTKTYASGLQALKRIDLEIRKGKIFALLGPNGAGKTTLIRIVCGIVTPTEGVVVADGHDIVRDYRDLPGGGGVDFQDGYQLKS